MFPRVPKTFHSLLRSRVIVTLNLSDYGRTPRHIPKVRSLGADTEKDLPYFHVLCPSHPGTDELSGGVVESGVFQSGQVSGGQVSKS